MSPLAPQLREIAILSAGRLQRTPTITLDEPHAVAHPWACTKRARRRQGQGATAFARGRSSSARTASQTIVRHDRRAMPGRVSVQALSVEWPALRGAALPYPEPPKAMRARRERRRFWSLCSATYLCHYKAAVAAREWPSAGGSHQCDQVLSEMPPATPIAPACVTQLQTSCLP